MRKGTDTPGVSVELLMIVLLRWPRGMPAYQLGMTAHLNDSDC
jgi:hypothetical protein